jgi:hypothetical protein
MLVKKLSPVLCIMGNAGVKMLSRIQARIRTVAAEANHVSTRNKSSRRRVFFINSLGILPGISHDFNMFKLFHALQCFQALLHDFFWQWNVAQFFRKLLSVLQTESNKIFHSVPY